MNQELHISSPNSGAEFEEYFALRWSILRAPHDLPRGSERDEFDTSPEANHISVHNDEGQLLGVGRLHFNSPEEAQIRYMAVTAESRGHGIGRTIVQCLEDYAQTKAVQRIVLNARDSVVGFYACLGYQRVGDGPTLFGAIEHVRMEKSMP